jgi:hypothetical protein
MMIIDDSNPPPAEFYYCSSGDTAQPLCPAPHRQQEHSRADEKRSSTKAVLSAFSSPGTGTVADDVMMQLCCDTNHCRGGGVRPVVVTTLNDGDDHHATPSDNNQKIQKEEERPRSRRTTTPPAPPPKKKRKSTNYKTSTPEPPKAAPRSPASSVVLGPSGKKERYAFPEKLYDLMEEAVSKGQDHIIAWANNGKGLLVKEVSQFENELLSKHFGHSNIRSFTRQLSYWGFKRAVTYTACGVHEFMHPNFARGQKSLVQTIVRTQKKGDGIKRGGVYINLRHTTAENNSQQEDLASTIKEEQLKCMQELVTRNATRERTQGDCLEDRRKHTITPPIRDNIIILSQPEGDVSTTGGGTPPRRVSVVYKNNDNDEVYSSSSSRGSRHEHCCVSDEDEGTENGKTNLANRKRDIVVGPSVPPSSATGTTTSVIVPQEEEEEEQEEEQEQGPSTGAEDATEEAPIVITRGTIYDPSLSHSSFEGCRRSDHQKRPAPATSFFDICASAPNYYKKRKCGAAEKTIRSGDDGPATISNHGCVEVPPGAGDHQDIALFEGRCFHDVHEAHEDGILLRCAPRQDDVPPGWCWSSNGYTTSDVFFYHTTKEESQQEQEEPPHISLERNRCFFADEKPQSSFDVLEDELIWVNQEEQWPHGFAAPRPPAEDGVAAQSIPITTIIPEVVPGTSHPLVGGLEQRQEEPATPEQMKLTLLLPDDQSNRSLLYACCEILLSPGQQEHQGTIRRQILQSTVEFVSSQEEGRVPPTTAVQQEEDDEISIFGPLLEDRDDDHIVQTAAV